MFIRKRTVGRYLIFAVRGIARLDAIERHIGQQLREQWNVIAVNLSAATSRMRQDRQRAISVSRRDRFGQWRANRAIARVRNHPQRFIQRLNIPVGLQQTRIVDWPRWRTHLRREAVSSTYQFFVHGLRVGQLAGYGGASYLAQSVATKRGSVTEQVGALPTLVRRHLHAG